MSNEIVVSNDDNNVEIKLTPKVDKPKETKGIGAIVTKDCVGQTENLDF